MLKGHPKQEIASTTYIIGIPQTMWRICFRNPRDILAQQGGWGGGGQYQNLESGAGWWCQIFQIYSKFSNWYWVPNLENIFDVMFKVVGGLRFWDFV